MRAASGAVAGAQGRAGRGPLRRGHPLTAARLGAPRLGRRLTGGGGAVHSKESVDGNAGLLQQARHDEPVAPVVPLAAHHRHPHSIQLPPTLLQGLHDSSAGPFH